MESLKQQINGCKTHKEKNKILSGADLRGAYLRGAYLSGADLSGADLRRADLSGADLSGADLSRANLRWADLSRADLSGADLSGADLSRANLRWADLSRADLRGAYLRGAYLSGADLSGADLRGAYLLICGRWSCKYTDGIISIGCESKTSAAWNLFFAGDDVIETRRGTFDFFEIEHNYRWFCGMLKRWPTEFGVVEDEVKDGH